MNKILSAFIVGIIFGIGLTLAQMINPAKVLSFLDLAGAWDPSLAFVMAGGAGIAAIFYPIILRRPRPLLAEKFQVPARTDIDARLMLGASLFGIGWGLAGLCPGPAIAVLALGRSEAVIFVLAMVTGFALYELYDRILMKSK